MKPGEEVNVTVTLRQGRSAVCICFRAKVDHGATGGPGFVLLDEQARAVVGFFRRAEMELAAAEVARVTSRHPDYYSLPETGDKDEAR